MVKINTKLSIVLQVLLFVVLYFGIQTYHKRSTKSGSVPPLYGTLLDGASITPESLKGHSYLVHFWATWCSICRLEQGTINAIAKDFPVITIATKSGSDAEVANFIKKQDLHFPVLVDDVGHWAKIFGVLAYPTSFIVDSTGDIRFVEVGYTTELGLRSRLLLADHT